MGSLSGYRTYISAGVIALATVAVQFGWIDQVTYERLLALAGAAGAAALRSAIANK